ncbi:MAG: NUDIX hydrolase [bacterium]|nr:NUDIX hydrolase [bacterium]
MADKVYAVGTIIENEKGETWGLVGGKIDAGGDAITAAVRGSS